MHDISGESLQIELGDRETPEEIELQEPSACCKHTDWKRAKHTHLFRRPKSCNAHVPELGKYHDGKIGLAGYAMVLDADICDLSIADFIRGVRFPQRNTSLKHTTETQQSEVYCPKQNTYSGTEKPHVYRLSSHREHSDLLLCNQNEKAIIESIPNRRGDQEHEPSSHMFETVESLAHLTEVFGLSSSKELDSDAESHTDSSDSEQSCATSQSINLGLRRVHSALSWSSSNSESISHSRRGDRPRPLSADSKHVRDTRERRKRANKSDVIAVLNWLRKGRKFEGVQDYNTQAVKAVRKFPSLSLINPERIWRAKSADLTRHSSVSRSSIRSSIGTISRSHKRAPDTQSDSYLAKILQEGYCSEVILKPEQRDQVIRLERSSLRQWLPSSPSGVLSPHTDSQSPGFDINSESLCKGRSQMTRGQNRSVKRRDALSKIKSKTDTLMKGLKKCSSLAAQSRCYKKQKSKLVGGQGRAIARSPRSPSVVQGLLRATSRLTVERNEEMQYPVVDSQVVGSVHIPAVSSNPLPSDSISISPLRVNDTPQAYPLGTMIPRVSEVSIKEEKGGRTFYHAVHVTHPQSSAMGEVWKLTESQQNEGTVPSNLSQNETSSNPPSRRNSVIESKPKDHGFQPTRPDPSMKNIHEKAKRTVAPPNRKQTNEQTGDMLQADAETTNGVLHPPKEDEPNKAQFPSLKLPHISGVQLRSLNPSPSWYSENSMQERWPIFFSLDEGLFSRLGRTDSLSSAQGAHELVNEIELSHEETCPQTPTTNKRTLRMQKMQDPLTTRESTMESLARFEHDRAPNIVERKQRQPGGIHQVQQTEQPSTIRNAFPMDFDKIIGRQDSQRVDNLDTGINIKKPPFNHKPTSEHTLTGYAITEPCVYGEQVDETFSEEDDTKGEQTTSEGSSENSADLLAREALGGIQITEGTHQPVICINEFDAQNVPSLYFGPKRDLSNINRETHVPPITARPPSPQATHSFEDSTDSDLIEPRKLCCFKNEPLTKTGDTVVPNGAPMAATPPGVRVTQEDLPLFQKYDDDPITGNRTYSDFSRRGYPDRLGKNIPTKRISVDVPLRSSVTTPAARTNRVSKGPSPPQKHHVRQSTELNSSPLDRDQPVALLSPRPVSYVQRKPVTLKPAEKDTSPASNFVENTTDVADSNFYGTPEYKGVNNLTELQKPSKTYNRYIPETDALPRRPDFYRGDPKLFSGLDWYDDDSMQERFPIFLSLEEDYFSQLDELESVETPQTVRTSICDNELLEAKINPRIHTRLAAPNKSLHKGRMMQDVSSASESTSGLLVTARPVSWKTVSRTVISDASEVIDRSGTHHSADSPATTGLWQRELDEGCSTVSELWKKQHDDHPPTKTSGPSLQRPVEKRQFVSRYTQTDHVCITECKCEEPSNRGSSTEPELAVDERSKPVRYNVETNYNARLKPQWKSNKGSAGSTDGRFKQNQPTSSNETLVPVTPMSPSSQKAAGQTEACTDSDLIESRKLWCFSTNKPTKRTAKDVPMDHKETNIPTSAKKMPDGLPLLQEDRAKQSDQIMQEQPAVPGGPQRVHPIHKGHTLGKTPQKRESDYTDLNLTLGSVHSTKKPEMPYEVEFYQTYPSVIPRLNLFHDDGMQEGYPRRISRYTQADFGCIANCGCTKQRPGSSNLGCMENAKSAFDKKTKNTIDRPDRITHDLTQIAEEGVNHPVSKTYESHLHSSSNLRRASHSTNRKEDTVPPEGQSLHRHSSSRKQPPVPAVQQQRTSVEILNKTVDHTEQRRESQKKVIRYPINSRTITDTPVLSADLIKKPLGSMKESPTLAVTNEAANLVNAGGNILHNRVLPNSVEQISDRPAEFSPPLVPNGAPLYPLSTDQNVKFQQLPLSSSDQYPCLPIDKLAFAYTPLTNALMFQPPTGEALTWTIHSHPLHSIPYSTALVLGEQIRPESSRVFELQPVCLMSYCGQPRQLSPITISSSANTTPMTAKDVGAMNRTDDPTVCSLQPKLNGSPSKPAENVLQHRSPSQNVTKDGPRDVRTSIQTRSPASSTVRATGCLPFLSKLKSSNTTGQRDNPKVDMSNNVGQSAALTSAAPTQKADLFFDTNDGQVLASISLDENAEKTSHLKHQLPVQAFNSDRMNPQNKLSFNSTNRVKVDVGHQTTGIPTNQVKVSPSQPTVPGLNDDQKHEANSHVAATRNEHRESAVQLDGIRGVMGVQLIPVGYLSGFAYPSPVRAICLSTPPACCHRCCVSTRGMNTLCDSSVQPVCHYSKAGSGLTATDLVLKREQPSRRFHCNPNQRLLSSTPHQTAVIPIHISGNLQQDGATEVLGSVFSLDATNVQPDFRFCPDYQRPIEGSVIAIPKVHGEFRKTDRTGLAQDALIYVACGNECRGKRHYTRKNYGDCRECCQCCKHAPHRYRPPSCPVSMRRKGSADLDLIKTNYQLLRVEKKVYLPSQTKTRRNAPRSPSRHKYPMFCQAPCLTSSPRVNCPGDRFRWGSPELGYLGEHKQRPHYKHDRRVH
ncbi:hypothetical protein CSKR_102899 [Clonorchis sinensis]|uniref:Uncharacterized protein n=1 Tax=Clonorchis sinensis TaxID=79923 RepID=A0A8T1MS77_CLOSI|nr:hypothetical protein CSKR_102899 [Clonorchis sinensis]